MPKEGNLTRRILFRFVDVLYLIMMVLILGVTVIIEKNGIYYPGVYTIPNLACYGLAGILLLLLVAAYQHFGQPSEKLYKGLVAAVMLITAAGITAFIVTTSPDEPVSDMMRVRNMARNFSAGLNIASPEIEKSEWAYFMKFYYNINLAALFSWINSLFGSWYAVEAAGGLCTLLSLLLITLSVKNITGNRFASLAVCILTAPFLALTKRAYVPYTDNFGLIFAALIIWLSTTRLKAPYKLVLLVLASVVGFWIKATIAILPLALILTLIIHARKEHFSALMNRRGAAAILLSALIIFGGMKAGPAIREHYGFSESNRMVSWHYFFMFGQDTKGMGTAKGKAFRELWKQKFQEGATLEEQRAAFLRQGLDWIRERGFRGNLDFYSKKLDIAYNDGYLGAAQKHPSALVNSMQVLWDMLLLILLAGAFRGSWKDRRRGFMCFLKASLLGVTMYLMLFEDRAKYLWMFLPVFMTFAGMTLARMDFRSKAQLP